MTDMIYKFFVSPAIGKAAEDIRAVEDAVTMRLGKLASACAVHDNHIYVRAKADCESALMDKLSKPRWEKTIGWSYNLSLSQATCAGLPLRILERLLFLHTRAPAPSRPRKNTAGTARVIPLFRLVPSR